MKGDFSMKKAILLSSLLMLCTALALAQDTQSSSPSDNASASGSNTVQGCLSGSSGNYMLTDATGVMWQLQGDESKLSANVNKEVEVTGTTGAEASASATNGPDSSTAGNTSSGAAGGTSAGASADASANANAAKTLNVTSIKKVADSCSSGK